MAPADLDVPPPRTPTALTSLSHSSSTSDDQNMVNVPPAATQQFVIPQQESFPEYPNGNITMQMIAHPSDDFMSTGWATHKTSSWKIKTFFGGKARKYKCLGFMVCTTKDCSFVVRPHQKASNWAKQLTSVCTPHETPLQHILCKATLTWKEFTKDTLIHGLIHEGHHSHPAPPSISPPPSAMNRFQQQILNSPSTLPKQLLVGSHYTPSVTSIHPSLSHLDRMGYHRRQLLKIAQTNNSITNILEWQEKNPNFIVASSLNTEDGFIFMQSSTQREISKDFVGTIQIDALAMVIWFNVLLPSMWNKSVAASL